MEKSFFGVSVEVEMRSGLWGVKTLWIPRIPRLSGLVVLILPPVSAGGGVCVHPWINVQKIHLKYLLYASEISILYI